MTISLSQLANSQSFGSWFVRTNQIANIISTNTVTSDATTTGSLTTGNVNVNGSVTILSLSTNSIGGGTIAVPANLNISTNTTFSNLAVHNANLIVNSASYLILGNVTANATVLNVGTLSINTSAISIGNSISNALFTQSTFFFGNSTSNVTIAPLSASITAKNATGTLIANSTILSLGNTTVNLLAAPASIVGTLATGSYSITPTGATFGNATSNLTLFSTGNITGLNGYNAVYITPTTINVGNAVTNSTINSTAFSGIANSATFFGGQLPVAYQTTAGLAANVATLVANNATNFAGQPQSYYANVTAPLFSTSVAVGANVIVNTSIISIANSLTNTIITQSSITIGNSTVNNIINSTSYSGIANSVVNFGGLTSVGYQTVAGLAANVAKLPANNSLFLGGQLPAYYANVTNPNFSASMQVGANVVANTSALLIGNTTVNAIYSGSSILLNNGNLVLNATSISLGNGTVNSVISTSNIATGNAYLSGSIFISGNLYVSGVTVSSGTSTQSGNLIPAVTNLYSIGNSSTTFTNVYSVGVVANVVDIENTLTIGTGTTIVSNSITVGGTTINNVGIISNTMNRIIVGVDGVSNFWFGTNTVSQGLLWGVVTDGTVNNYPVLFHMLFNSVPILNANSSAFALGNVNFTTGFSTSNSTIYNNTMFLQGSNNFLGIGVGIQDFSTSLSVVNRYSADASGVGAKVSLIVNNAVITSQRSNLGSLTTVDNISVGADSIGNIIGLVNYGEQIVVRNGNTTASSNAYSTYAIGSQVNIYNYANGTGNTTIENAYGYEAIIRPISSGSINTAIGVSSYIQAQNTIVTGNINRAFGFYTNIGLASANASISNGYMYYGIYTASANITGTAYGIYMAGEDVNYLSNTLILGNSVVNATINSTSYTGTSNNSLYLGGLVASGYQTTAGLAANVALLPANNSLYLGGLTAASYQTLAGLAANVAPLTTNNSVNFGGQPQSYYANVTAPSFTTSVAVGANVILNTSLLSIGNSTSNVVLNSTSLKGGIGFSRILIGSDGANSFWLGTNNVANGLAFNIATDGTANNYPISAGFKFLGGAFSMFTNSTAFTIGTGSLSLGANVNITNSSLSIGNSTVNTTLTSTGLSVGVGSLTSTFFTGTANNSTNFGGQLPAYYANVTSPSFTTSIIVGGDINNNNTAINSVAVSIGNTTNYLVANTLMLKGGTGFARIIVGTDGGQDFWFGTNTIANGLVWGIQTDGTANNFPIKTMTTFNGATVSSINTSSMSLTGISLNIGANTTLNSNALTIGNTTVNATVNSTLISIGNTTINSTINATSFSGTSNNTLRVGGVAANLVLTLPAKYNSPDVVSNSSGYFINYYVSKSGNDTNTGGSSDPFLTILACVNSINRSLIPGTYFNGLPIYAKVNIGIGTFSEISTISLNGLAAPYWIFAGDTQTTTLINFPVGASTNAFNINAVYTISFSNMQISCYGFSLYLNTSVLTGLTNVTFVALGSGTSGAIYLHGTSSFNGLMKISLNGAFNWGFVTQFSSQLSIATTGSTINYVSGTSFLSGNFFSDIASFVSIIPSSLTFSGSPTGQRYIIGYASAISTSGSGPNYLPGSTAGSSDSSSTYS